MTTFASVPDAIRLSSGATKRAAKTMSKQGGVTDPEFICTFFTVASDGNKIQGLLAITDQRIVWALSTLVFLSGVQGTRRQRPEHGVTVVAQSATEVQLLVDGVGGDKSPMHLDLVEGAELVKLLVGRSAATDAPPPAVPAGWYPNGNVQEYWDGARWTGQTAPLPAP